MGTFLITANSIVESDRAHSGLLRTVFKSFGNKKLTRLDSDHMCLILLLILDTCKHMIKFYMPINFFARKNSIKRHAVLETYWDKMEKSSIQILKAEFSEIQSQDMSSSYFPPKNKPIIRRPASSANQRPGFLWRTNLSSCPNLDFRKNCL